MTWLATVRLMRPSLRPRDELTAATAENCWRAMPDSLAVRLSGGQWQPAKHLSLISYLLYLASVGVLNRLIISCPPGSGKSEICSHWNPVWLLSQDPRRRVILASYEATLSEEWGKAARTTLQENHELLRVDLRQDSQASNRWRTVESGGMWTTGTGGAATGRRATDLLIDDPHKDFQEAHSAVRRSNVYNWFRSVARTRLLPSGSIVLVMTRWHEADLAGQLIDQAEAGGEQWTVVRFPAIAEEDETIETVIGANTCTRLRDLNVPLPQWSRREGEALWPRIYNPVTARWERWYDLEELADIRASVGEYTWGGLYMQRPSSPTGSYFPVEQWRTVDVAPAHLRWVRRWDLAGSEDSGDWTAGALIGRDDATGAVYIADITRARLAIAGVKRLVALTAELDRARFGRKVQIILEQEPGSSGKSMAAEFVSTVLAGYPAKALPTSGDKIANALPLASQQQAGNVYLVRQENGPGDYGPAGWWDPFIEECRAFDSGPHDDQVDAASHGYSDLIAAASKTGKARVRSAAGSRLNERWGTPAALPR